MLQNPDRHAGFVVLKAADIPSVLVEMGFMSNPNDEAALRQAGSPQIGGSGDAPCGGGVFRRDQKCRGPERHRRRLSDTIGIEKVAFWSLAISGQKSPYRRP